jgi:hypothetical protein
LRDNGRGIYGRTMEEEEYRESKHYTPGITARDFHSRQLDFGND